jgi:NAD(P)-dependent dehydrogenase (short-subunit alcohol dehydrogenase family)
MSIAIDLSGKRAFITGASSGFGAHFAAVLAGAGAEIVLGARRVEALEETARKLPVSARAKAMRLDVRDPASIRAAFAAAGPIDLLVNNAGVGLQQPVLEARQEDWDFVVGTNLKGAFDVAQEAARAIRTHARGGAIINVASILGLRQGSQVSLYAIAKAGVVQMTKQMALELARYNIRVNALAPGYFSTDMNSEFLASEAGAVMLKRVPMRRAGALHELDGPLLLLASDLASYMTGSVIEVDGGRLVSTL